MSDSKVVKMDQVNWRDIPSSLRKLADEVEAGQLGELERLFVITVNDSGYMQYFDLGTQTTTKFDQMGVLQTVVTRLALDWD